MKKTVKKLVLAKETLKKLESDKLQVVQGGMASFTACGTIKPGTC